MANPFIILLSSVLVAPPLWGCSCLPASTTDCERYWSADIVFEGRVMSAEPKSIDDLRRKLSAALPHDLFAQLENNSSPGLLREVLRFLLPQSEYSKVAKMTDEEVEATLERKFSTQRVRVMVTEAFRGIDVHEVVLTGDFGSSCSVEFREHESYLIYAWRDKETQELQTGVCAGTRHIDEAANQLKYIRGLKTGETPIRIFGFVTADPADMTFGLRASKPLNGIPITLYGEKVWTTTTNQEGNYELTGVSPGTYELRAMLPYAKLTHANRKIELTAGRCWRQNFLAIQGR